MTATRWRRARQIIQIISAAFFFLLAFLTYRGFESLIPLDLYFRFDPLVAFSAMIASRAIIVAPPARARGSRVRIRVRARVVRLVVSAWRAARLGFTAHLAPC